MFADLLCAYHSSDSTVLSVFNGVVGIANRMKMTGNVYYFQMRVDSVSHRIKDATDLSWE